MERCIVCGNRIKKNSIPRIKPEVFRITLKDVHETHHVCDVCGNMLALMIRCSRNYKTVDDENILSISNKHTTKKRCKMENIYLSDYLEFNPDNGRFELSPKAQEILYRQKQIICSYSGCNDWGHNFFCELLDLYSGTSQYNYALGTVIYKDQLAAAFSAGHAAEITDWVNRHKTDLWFCKAVNMMKQIIEDLPEED